MWIPGSIQGGFQSKQNLTDFLVHTHMKISIVEVKMVYIYDIVAHELYGIRCAVVVRVVVSGIVHGREGILTLTLHTLMVEDIDYHLLSLRPNNRSDVQVNLDRVVSIFIIK